jgi:catecholate siderophore receptor
MRKLVALGVVGLGCVAAATPGTVGASTLRRADLRDARRAAPHLATTPAARPGAQEPAQQPAPPAADSVGRRRFDIPAAPLLDALGDFSRQSEMRVVIDRAVTAGLRSPAVSGTYTAGEALARLLAGSGLAARFADAQTVVVSKAGTRESAAQTLRPVVVKGSADRASSYAALRTSTATKTDTPLRDTPQSVTVVTRTLIADQAMQTMGDVVRYVPGITMGQGEGHRDAPTIRGNSSTADFFVDGVRDDAQYLRDLYNVDRVEALKGANAMIFGRGGGGGVINRVSKEAQWAPTRALTLEGGSFGQKRASVDVGQGLGQRVAARVNGMYENSDAFRDATTLERYGINPTLAVAAGSGTAVRLGYEFFHDDRTVDRGIPSYRGRPSEADIETYFGNPHVSYAEARVHAATATVEHSAPGGVTIRNRTRFADYDKFYQNVFPGGAVDSTGTLVPLAAYNHAIGRRNLFNQTELTYGVGTGVVRHTLLAGVEAGRQSTDNFRRTGYFDDTAATMIVPFDQPTVATAVTFRQNATDADSRAVTTVAAAYAQDQVALSAHWQAIVGVRYERFNIRFNNDRTGQGLQRDDQMVSPRAGLVFKPAEPLSLYGAYSVSYLPSSGDQFTTLTVTSQTLAPERFTNYELGAKWDVRPALELTSAVYRLDRTNTSAPDPADPSRVVQTGSQRTTGYEVGLAGEVTSAWQVAGGYASQRATIVSRTAAAKAGATVPLVPHHTVSLWNKYRLGSALGVGLGVVHQADMYAAIDNSVTLPSFTRLDGAVYLTLYRGVRAQVNVENLFDTRYYATSQGNNNILPGAPRTVRLSVTTGL